MGRWDGYDSLMPSESDLADDWRKTPKSMMPAFIRPYEYAPGRKPITSRIDVPGDMLREMVAELKDGCPVPVRVPIYGNTNSDELRFVVESFLEEMQQRTKLRLAIMPHDETCQGAITLDDKDGKDFPEVKFCLVPREGGSRYIDLDEIVRRTLEDMEREKAQQT